MHLPQPTFHTVGSLGEKDLQKFDLLVVPAFASDTPDEGPQIETSPAATQLLEFSHQDFAEIALQWPDFKGKAGELIEIPIKVKGRTSRLFIVGFGENTIEDARKAGAALGRKVKSKGFTIYSAYVGGYDAALAHLVALSLSQYGWSLKSSYSKSEVSARELGPTKFIFAADLTEAATRATIIAEATWLTRDLIHTPSNIKNPPWMAQQAQAAVKRAHSADLKVTIKKGRELEMFGGLRAVGNSSPQSPRLIQITYSPAESKNWPHVVLVGKGITYDTGGISLKRPYDLMVPMKSDMAGAAAIMAATIAMAKIKPKVRVTALMMCAENLVSETAQRPSDVITQYGGTSVEIINTDAEGRLVLADGLAYANLELQPDYLLDIATLTGAATLGLGKQYAAMYSRNPALTAQLHEIGERIGDRVWSMPLIDDYLPALVSHVADFNHDASAKSFSAGSVTAALFLEQFVGKQNWVHLDIAGPARSEVDAGEFVKGGTGFGTRLLIEWMAAL